MRYRVTRAPILRMKRFDQELRARNWPTDKTLAVALEVDPRTIRRDLEDHLRDAIRMFSVHRIKSLRETGETFERPPVFRVEDHLKGSFRAVRGDGEYRVVRPFRPEVALRSDESLWHSSPVLERQSDGTRIVRSSSRT